MAKRILGWKLEAGDRAALLERFPPRYAETVAEHITHGAANEAPPMPVADTATVIGRADDRQGVEALVVEIAGGSGRWDGSTYHITWSLGPKRAANESNDVIADKGWDRVEDVPEVVLTTAEWP